jgi:hypothetical protein
MKNRLHENKENLRKQELAAALVAVIEDEHCDRMKTSI